MWFRILFITFFTEEASGRNLGGFETRTIGANIPLVRLGWTISHTHGWVILWIEQHLMQYHHSGLGEYEVHLLHLRWRISKLRVHETCHAKVHQHRSKQMEAERFGNVLFISPKALPNARDVTTRQASFRDWRTMLANTIGYHGQVVHTPKKHAYDFFVIIMYFVNVIAFAFSTHRIRQQQIQTMTNPIAPKAETCAPTSFPLLSKVVLCQKLTNGGDYILGRCHLLVHLVHVVHLLRCRCLIDQWVNLVENHHWWCQRLSHIVRHMSLKQSTYMNGWSALNTKHPTPKRIDRILLGHWGFRIFDLWLGLEYQAFVQSYPVLQSPCASTSFSANSINEQRTQGAGKKHDY